MSVAGFILVGGFSRRMGRDKALLPWDGRPLIEHVAERIRAATGAVTLIGDPARYAHLGLECIADLRPALGPLAGIETMLAARKAQRNLVLACDMPDVSLDHLHHLLDCSGNSVISQDATGKLHPLCAVYDVNCLPHVRTALDSGRLKLLDFVAELRPRIVRYPGTLSNINTLEDLASAQR